MSNYTKTTDFEAKDSLPSGDSGKIIRGSEFETEFDNIATAIASKSDANNPTFTGTVTIDGLTVNGNTVLGNAATDTVTVTADIASNLLPSADDTYNLGASGAEWNDLFIDGTANIDSLVAGSGSFTSISTTGDMTFGDDDKALFGASNDLKIYHASNNQSYIHEVGSGDLNILATNLKLQDAGGSTKVLVNSTGINVTGTVTADGLTSSGNLQIQKDTPAIELESPDGSSNSFKIIPSLTNTLNFGTFFKVNDTDALKIANNGDISFYEDTGTTAKFFWDASEESLRVPLGLYNNSINAFPSTGYAAIYSTGTGGSAPFNEAGHLVLQARSSGALRDIIFATGNGAAERMRIDSSGRVGIGTTSPNYLLDVEGSGALFRINSTSGNSLLQFSVPDTTSITGINFGDAGSSNAGYMYYRHTGDSLAFGTAGAEAMRIDASGNVGIGTSSPANQLDVVSSTNATARIEGGANGDASLKLTESGISGFQLKYDGGDNNLYVGGGTSGSFTTHMAVNRDSGNVGIGTSSPASLLDVQRNSAVSSLLSDSQTAAMT